MAGLTADGYTLQRASDYLTVIRDAYETDTGLAIDWERDVFLGNITAIMADRLGAIDEVTQAVYDAWDPNNAAGLQLTNLSLIVGVDRQDATFSVATTTLTGTAGTVVIAGKRVRGGGEDGDAEWELLEDATIGGGGTVNTQVQALEAGEIIATAGEINEIVTPVAGWDSVTNAAAATPGQDRETDAELRERRADSLQISGGRSINALRSNLLALVDDDGVAILDAAIVLENDTPAAVTIDGESLAANSLKVIVWPDSLTAAKEEQVAETIYDLKPIGIQTNGTDVVYEVTGQDLNAKEIRFDYATQVDIALVATVEMESSATGTTPPPTFADVEAEIEEIMADYISGLSVGEDVRRTALSTLIGVVDGVRHVDITLAKHPASPADQDITIAAGEIAYNSSGTLDAVEAP